MSDFLEATAAFIRTLYPGQARIALHEPRFLGNEKRYLSECVDSTFVSSVGPFVDRFEAEMAAYTGAARAVVCVNGTAALHMALILADVKPGDEVITQSLTFIATCNAIRYAGATPVFADIDEQTLGLSPERVRQWLSLNTRNEASGCIDKRTGNHVSACVPMHTFGHPIRMKELQDVCAEFKIPIIEDAAESLGSLYCGRHTGTYGKVGILSFNGNKTITTGGGGMLLFNDEELGARAKHLTTQAKMPHKWAFVHDEIGYNYRMPNINAALGCAQLERLEEFLVNKRETAARYAAFFEGSAEASFIREPKHCRSNYWLNAVLLESSAKRDELLAYLNDHDIMARPAWEPMHHLDMFRSCPKDDLTTTESVAASLVNLPSSVRL